MSFTRWFESLPLLVKMAVLLGLVAFSLGIAAGFVFSVARFGNLVSTLLFRLRKKGK